MKKFLFIISLVILFVIEVNAIDFRLVGGINFSRTKSIFAIDMVDFVSWGRGFLVGGGVELTLSENLSIELEGLYTQKSSVFERWDWEHGETREFVDKIDEISFPVLVKFRHLFNFPFYLFGGGEFAYDYSEEALDDRFDYGAVFGVGIEFKKIISSIEIRLHIGYKADSIALVIALPLLSTR